MDGRVVGCSLTTDRVAAWHAVGALNWLSAKHGHMQRPRKVDVTVTRLAEVLVRPNHRVGRAIEGGLWVGWSDLVRFRRCIESEG